MKLLFALLVVSALTLKVEGADKAYNEACAPGTDTCTASNSECKDDGAGTNKCLCKMDYGYDGTTDCKKLGGQSCTEATKADCQSGECTSDKCEGKAAKGVTCTVNGDCESDSCDRQSDGTEKCGSGSATIMASLALMLVAFVTTRFL